MEWFDISSAPKDGSLVLATDGKTTCTVFFNKQGEWEFGKIIHSNEVSGWQSGFYPTHYIAIPNPPEEV